MSAPKRRIVGETGSTLRHSYPRISGAPVNDSVGTADALFSDLDDLFCFHYDPCPLGGLDTPGVPDGLTTPWGLTTFVNPPYSQISGWLAHAVNNLALYGSRSVFLIPAHVETQYWNDIVTYWASEIWFCITGLRFNGYKNKFAAPMCLVLFGQFDDMLLPARATGQRINLGENAWFISLLPRGISGNRLRRADARRCAQKRRVVK